MNKMKRLRNFLFRASRYERLPLPSPATVRAKGSRYWPLCRKILKTIVWTFTLTTVTVFLGLVFGDRILDHFDNAELPYTHISTATKLHVLIPASQSNPNLCKTTMSLQLLGYPTPTFMGWDERFEDDKQVDGGARLGTKIIYALHSVLKNPAHDDDLVLIADGYDTWFQLPPDVLIQRFNDMNRAANVRLAQRAGKRALRTAKLSQKIVFGARRSCDSSRVHGIRCDMAPEPPSPKEWYADSGDNIIARTEYNVNPPRFLDSGYIMGRMIDVRTLLIRAKEIIDRTPNAEHVYDGSAQPIFNRIFNDQETQRNRWYHRLLPSVLPRQSEFGIGIDYFSELSHSTFDSEKDAAYLTYSSSGDVEMLAPTTSPLKSQLSGHYLSDCALNLPSTLPHDIAISSPPSISSNFTSWNNLPLLTNLCTGTIPVLIHHNGEKTLRESTWENVWFTPYAREMVRKIDGSAGGWTDTRKWIEWEELCPREWESMLFPGGGRGR